MLSTVLTATPFFLSLLALSTSAQMIPTATAIVPMNALTYKGCFSTSTPLVDHGPYTFQSSGNCQPICYQLQMPVMGLVNGSNCFCGSLLPPADAKVDDAKCNTPCNGFNKEYCTSTSRSIVLQVHMEFGQPLT